MGIHAIDAAIDRCAVASVQTRRLGGELVTPELAASEDGVAGFAGSAVCVDFASTVAAIAGVAASVDPTDKAVCTLSGAIAHTGCWAALAGIGVVAASAVVAASGVVVGARTCGL
ncbi:MAG: hypothetical protein ACI9MR_005080 [Myxococcota bacterium]